MFISEINLQNLSLATEESTDIGGVIMEEILLLLLLGKEAYQKYTALTEEEQAELFHNIDFKSIPLLQKYSSLIQKNLNQKPESELSQEFGLSIKLLRLLKHNATNEEKRSYFSYA
jgi:hypothetical protein